jgi:hypothetical protein
MNFWLVFYIGMSMERTRRRPRKTEAALRKCKCVGLSVPGEIWVRLEEEANADYRTKSSYVAAILRRHFAALDAKTAARRPDKTEDHLIIA